MVFEWNMYREEISESLAKRIRIAWRSRVTNMSRRYCVSKNADVLSIIIFRRRAASDARWIPS